MLMLDTQPQLDSIAMTTRCSQTSKTNKLLLLCLDHMGIYITQWLTLYQYLLAVLRYIVTVDVINVH